MMAANLEDLPPSPPISPGIIDQLVLEMEAPLGAEQLPSLPQHHYAAGWRRHRSANSGRYFYFNILSKESRWTLPLVEEPRPASAPAIMVPTTPQPEVFLNRPSYPASGSSQTSNQSNLATAGSSSSSSSLQSVGIPDADDRDVSGRFHLGGKRYVVVKRFKEQPYINIREYYQPKDRAVGRLYAGKKGINLTLDQWRALCKNMGSINHTLTTYMRQK
ncbi:uncharacterized protein [Amphiura filiformis]|uniref:uncharacterized protein n=1 Tax=Amphiura filiformis TaxID=82378 RepID=UPI003B218A4E